MPRHEYVSECDRRARKKADRASERKLDKVRFAWFCIGATFAVLVEIVVELAFRRAGM